MPFDGKAMAADVLKAVREFVVRSVTPLQAKIDALERLVDTVPDAINGAVAAIPKPVDGKDADPVDYVVIGAEMDLQVRKAVAEAVEQMPVPKDGTDGKDAAPVDYAAIEGMVSEAVSAIPAPKDGKSVTVDDVRPLIADEVAKAAALIPVPKDGTPGLDAFDIAVSRGFDGGKKQWLESLRGEKGENGPAGSRGEKGEQGSKGDPGERGLDGKDGAHGERGLPGEKGDPGLDGKDGASGINGKDGADGINGKDGDPGKDGVQGVIGERGPQGEKGLDGADAFTIAKGNGFVGAVTDWLISLHGKDGAAGRDGRDGTDGSIGKDGADGRDGRDGSVGKDGADGRDALEIEIMDGIDVQRSYPRGTFASFNGGTFRAVRATDPLETAANPLAAGWGCKWRGQASSLLTLEDGGRYLVQTTKFCDGTEDVSRNKTAITIYRGVYQSGKKYEAGDSVTFDGSQWTAKDETYERPRERPVGGEQVWQLSTKAGRPGKDAPIDGAAS